MDSKLCLVLLLVAGQAMTSNGFSLLGAGCSAIVSALEFAPCKNAFQKGIEPYINANGGVPTFAVCCQVNILESCVSSKVEATCGSDAGDTTKTTIRAILTGMNFISNGEMDCVGHAYYRPESPVCWPQPVQVGAAVILAIILISCCCASCCRCCRGKKGSVHGPPTIVQMIPASVPQFQPAQRGQVPYIPLNKTTV